MAGGMGGRGVPVGQRLRAGPGTPYDAVGQVAGEDRGTGPARHCWVLDPADGLGGERPALLLEWRQAPGGWQGRVVYAAQPRPGRWVTVEEWVDAVRLTHA